MRENRLHGSEGGEGESPFRPLSTSNYPATRRLTPSCGVNDGLRQPLSLDYRSHPSHPRKDCLPPSQTTMQGLFLALSRFGQPIPALDRCEPQYLPLESIMPFLVVEYLYKCLLFHLS